MDLLASWFDVVSVVASVLSGIAWLVRRRFRARGPRPWPDVDELERQAAERREDEEHVAWVRRQMQPLHDTAPDWHYTSPRYQAPRPEQGKGAVRG